MVKQTCCALLAAIMMVMAGSSAFAQNVAEPFKLGTFNIGGNERVGIVLRDSLVVDLSAANRELERRPTFVAVPMPTDMSDRGGRPENPPRFGSDWFIGKGHDTFARMGPFIVPKEFIPNPQNITQKLWVNGTIMQDGVSTDMIHNINELIEYGSSIMTLFPGDVIAAGSPAGTGMSRSVRPEQIFLKPGDKIVATIEGIGTLNHTVRAEAPTR